MLSGLEEVRQVDAVVNRRQETACFFRGQGVLLPGQRNTEEGRGFQQRRLNTLRGSISLARCDLAFQHVGLRETVVQEGGKGGGWAGFVKADDVLRKHGDAGAGVCLGLRPDATVTVDLGRRA